jgi:hypothetical protein
LLVPQDPSRIAVASWQFVGEDGAATGATVANYEDKKLGTKCQMKVAGDEVIRCIPASLIRIFFADARCTIPFVIPGPADPWTRWFPGQIVDRLEDGCGYEWEVFARGPQRPAPETRFAEGPLGVGCGQVPIDQPGRYFAVGPQITPKHFVAFRESQPPGRRIRRSGKR